MSICMHQSSVERFVYFVNQLILLCVRERESERERQRERESERERESKRERARERARKRERQMCGPSSERARLGPLHRLYSG